MTPHPIPLSVRDAVMIAQGIAARSDKTRRGLIEDKSPVLACEDAPSTVLDCLLNLELQYEALQDLRKDTTDRQLEQRWKANRVRREMSNG